MCAAWALFVAPSQPDGVQAAAAFATDSVQTNGGPDWTADVIALDPPDSSDDDGDDDDAPGASAATGTDPRVRTTVDEHAGVVHVALVSWVSRTHECQSLRGPPAGSPDASDADVDDDPDALDLTRALVAARFPRSPLRSHLEPFPALSLASTGPSLRAPPLRVS